jgi:hypothetical protein
VIVSHGDTDGLKLGNGEKIVAAATQELNLATNIGVSDLADKNIENLHLRACLVGSIYRSGAYYPNLAEEFISTKDNIENVYAFDCSLEVLPFEDGKYSMLGVTKTTMVLPIDNGVPISWGLESDIFQQCWYSWMEIPTPPISIYYKEINGIAISCKNCYFNDYDMQFTGTDQIIRFMQPTDYEYHYDPILQRYGYDF